MLQVFLFSATFSGAYAIEVSYGRAVLAKGVTVAPESKSSALIGKYLQAGQEKTITGRVTDDKGAPLIGVTVLVKGTTVATATNAQGDFSIATPQIGGNLVFSFIGFEPQDVSINGRSVINVSLAPSANQMEEVVVVGYGEQKRANVLGAVATLNPAEVQDIPAANLSTLLQGRMPGVNVGQSSGRPGAGTSLSIRTRGSWTAEEPLYVIDGFIREGGEGKEAFDLLDPSEVESISILKDAAAAVYGARGAGGVVLVKTKTGKAGKAKINYSGSYGINDARQVVDVLNAYDHALLVNNRLRITNPTNYATNKDWFTDDELDQFKTLDHNWLDGAWGNSSTVRHTLNMSGGSNRVRYFGGGSYYKENGNLEGAQYQKYTLRLGLDADITDNLTASFNLSSNNDVDRRPFNREDGGNDAMDGTFESLLQTPRWIPSYINGLPVGYNQYQHALEITNRGGYSKSEATSTVVNAALEYKVPFIQGLSLKGSYNQSKRSADGKSYRLPYELYSFVMKGGNNHIFTDEVARTTTVKNDNRISFDHTTSKNYQLNANVAYNRSFGLHNVGALLVYEQSEFESENFDALREDIVVEDFEQFGGFSADKDDVRSGAAANGRMSYVGRLNYRFDERYLLEASFRYEGSTKFPPETRWGLFPAVAVGWRISEESFFKDNVGFMNNLKLRLSAGVVGNDGIGSSQWVRSYSTTNGAYLGGSGLTSAIQNRNEGVASTGVTWEKSSSFNGGIELGFVNNIRMEFDAYYKNTWDILDRPSSSLPQSAGFKNIPSVNYGEMEAWGYDGSVGYTGNIGKDFGYDVGVNMSWGKSKVLKKYQSPGVEGTWEDEIGRMPGGEVGYIAKGIIRTQEELDALLEANPNYTIKGRKPELGMLDFVDVGGPNRSNEPDGKIDGNDQRIIAPAVASLGFGINLGASYKGFRVSTNLGLGGFGTYSFYDKEAMRSPSATLNGPSFWRDHYSADNPNAAYPAPTDYGYNNERSTFWMRDGLTMNLNIVNASYQFPKSITEKIGVPEIRIYFTGRNLWRIINSLEYKDPSLSRFNSYPMMRSFNFGLNISI
ncbi:SusC/RagA family TonB-linked outer membrane protein [Rufibacter tibetensis]|uniref:SusC/RagA family TonB-linked outer membrane protein n=1 Tax=Rufibacter tibetensis TaxID=512763 RepID=UPI0014704FA5|nr:TonB-dependent receptor [Rufibacter tibetensis]